MLAAKLFSAVDLRGSSFDRKGNAAKTRSHKLGNRTTNSALPIFRGNAGTFRFTRQPVLGARLTLKKVPFRPVTYLSLAFSILSSLKTQVLKRQIPFKSPLPTETPAKTSEPRLALFSCTQASGFFINHRRRRRSARTGCGGGVRTGSGERARRAGRAAGRTRRPGSSARPCRTAP